jgi:hypothetical protein
MPKKFRYLNKWSNFVFAATICAFIEVILCIILFNIGLSEDMRLITVFLSLNISTMLITGLVLLAYIHYKSPHYFVILEDDMIIVPKYGLIPDSYFIYFTEIIFFGEQLDGQSKFYKLVYNGGSVEIKKDHLKNPSDIDEIVYYLKEVAL